VAQGDPVAIPRAAFERVSALCLALPEVTVRLDPSRVDWRSTAHSFDIRRRSFCLLIATADTSGTVVPRIVLRVHRDDRNALVSIAYPCFPSRAGRDRVAVLLTDDTEWGEIRELVTESYRLLAPRNSPQRSTPARPLDTRARAKAGRDPLTQTDPTLRHQRVSPRGRSARLHGRRHRRPADSRMQGSRVCPPLPDLRGHRLRSSAGLACLMFVVESSPCFGGCLPI